MKKIIPIFLFLIICINHLHIMDAVVNLHVCMGKQKSENAEKLPSDEEAGKDKEASGKEKMEEQEKFYSRSNYSLTRQFCLSAKEKFTCFNTKLNMHPYQEDDLQPPKTA